MNFPQVLTNLIANAIKFSPEGRQITMKFVRKEGVDEQQQVDGSSTPMIGLIIRDEGIGIPNNELEAVFDKFIALAIRLVNA